MIIKVTKRDGTTEDIIHVSAVTTEAESYFLNVAYEDNGIKQKTFQTGEWVKFEVESKNVGGF